MILCSFPGASRHTYWGKNSSHYCLADLLPFCRLSLGGGGEGWVNLVERVSSVPTRQELITQPCRFVLCDIRKVT